MAQHHDGPETALVADDDQHETRYFQGSMPPDDQPNAMPLNGCCRRCTRLGSVAREPSRPPDCATCGIGLVDAAVLNMELIVAAPMLSPKLSSRSRQDGRHLRTGPAARRPWRASEAAPPGLAWRTWRADRKSSCSIRSRHLRFTMVVLASIPLAVILNPSLMPAQPR